jgi:hypothetical protein
VQFLRAIYIYIYIYTYIERAGEREREKQNDTDIRQQLKRIQITQYIFLGSDGNVESYCDLPSNDTM